MRWAERPHRVDFRSAKRRGWDRAMRRRPIWGPLREPHFQTEVQPDGSCTDREGGFERRSASATADGLDKAIAMTEGPPISPHGGVETFVLALSGNRNFLGTPDGPEKNALRLIVALKCGIEGRESVPGARRGALLRDWPEVAAIPD